MKGLSYFIGFMSAVIITEIVKLPQTSGWWFVVVLGATLTYSLFCYFIKQSLKEGK